MNLFAGPGKEADHNAGRHDEAPKSASAKRLQALRSADFNLRNYFLFTSLWLFLAVLAFIYHHESAQREFFDQVQEEQSRFLGEIQSRFAEIQEEEARRALLAIHEAGNVNITRLFANALWEKEFRPFVESVQAIDVGDCRALPDVKDDKGKDVPSAEKKACFAAIGKRIMAQPRFAAIDAQVFDLMKKSTVFKIKVFDLRGITVYSSEHAQIGEDKLNNKGWQSAAAGKPASELTHRNKFSAFEGVVENRDLISSYLPVYAPGSDMVVGVFEIYSDVTPFIAQITDSTARIRKASAENQRRMEEVIERNRERVASDSLRGQVIVVGLLITLFLALFFIVQRAHELIRRQQAEKTKAQQQLAQSEKMASLGQMVAGVAHQLNTPLAFTKSNVELAIDQIQSWQGAIALARKIADHVKGVPGSRASIASSRQEIESIAASPEDVEMTCEMLGDVLRGVDQMAELVHHMRTFTRLDRSKMGEVDLNETLHSVVYIARSVIRNNIELVEDYGDLQGRLCSCVPSQINQVVLNLVNNAAQAIGEGPGQIVVRTRLEGDHFRVEVEDNGHGIPPEILPHIFEPYFTTKEAAEGTGIGLSIAREIVENHHGRIEVESRPGRTVFRFTLPLDLHEVAGLA